MGKKSGIRPIRGQTIRSLLASSNLNFLFSFPSSVSLNLPNELTLPNLCAQQIGERSC